MLLLRRSVSRIQPFVRCSSVLTSASLVADASALRVAFAPDEARRPTGAPVGATFDSLFLRDHCTCASCLHPGTAQRLHATESLLDSAPTLSTAALGGGGVRVSWSDGHTATFSAPFLASVAYAAPPGGVLPPPSVDPASDARSRVLWDRGTWVGKRLPCVGYNDLLSSDSALRQALTSLRDVGMVEVQGMPVVRKSGSDAGVDEVACTAATEAALLRFGPLQTTLYGEGMWRTEVKPAGEAIVDTAYGSLPLPGHTDGCYLADQPGLQSFHCLVTDAGGGGRSTLVDGFAVGRWLQSHAPDTFAYFSTTSVPYHHTDPVHHLRQRRPVFRVDPAGVLTGVSFNNDDRAPLTPPAGVVWGAADVSTFYSHLRVLLSALRSPDFCLDLLLQPGTMLVFVNNRVLHGRTALTPLGTGRLLVGAYHSEEAWMSKLRVLSAKGV